MPKKAVKDGGCDFTSVSFILLLTDGHLVASQTDLINDVREQNGGGGEPLVMEDRSNE
jgi:hypothetical protein